MADLVPAPGAYDALPEYLLREVPGFAESPEFELVAANRDLPGVVTAAFGRYLERLQAMAIRRQADAAEEAALDRAYAVVEEMAASPDADVQNALQVEIFEHMHVNDVVVAVVETRLGPVARSLYRRWAV
ncbi:MAG TPA: hypothetical protein VH650_05275 [Gaiellaceae bacterium]|jgi:hypothetical protein